MHHQEGYVQLWCFQEHPFFDAGQLRLQYCCLEVLVVLPNDRIFYRNRDEMRRIELRLLLFVFLSVLLLALVSPAALLWALVPVPSRAFALLLSESLACVLEYFTKPLLIQHWNTVICCTYFQCFELVVTECFCC